MREYLARLSLIILTAIWLIVGGAFLIPALGWFRFMAEPCLVGSADCDAIASHINDALLFGRTDPGQLRDALYWFALILVPLSLAAIFIGIRLMGFVFWRQPYSFTRIASAFGIMTSVSVLLLLAQTGLADSWLNWAHDGCANESGMLLCAATDEISNDHRIHLVELYQEKLRTVNFVGTIGALVVLALSLMLLWLPTTPTRIVMNALTTTPHRTPKLCDQCGARGTMTTGEDGKEHPVLPTCALCQREMQPTDSSPTPRRRFTLRPGGRTAAILLGILFVSTHNATAQPDNPTWASPDQFCAEPNVHCIEIFGRNNIAGDGITNLRVRNLSNASTQNLLEISFNISNSIFTNGVTTARVHLPSPSAHITTLTVDNYCQLVIAALAPTPVTITSSNPRAQPYIDFTANEAAAQGTRSVRAFAYCSLVNLPSTSNPGFPPSAVGELYIQSDASHQSRLGEPPSLVRPRLQTVFTRLQTEQCASSEAGVPLTFNNAAAQLAVFIASEIVEGEAWQENVWERYHINVPTFDNHYAGIYCLLNQPPPSLIASLEGFPEDGSEFPVGTRITLTDNSSGNIVNRNLTIVHDGEEIYNDEPSFGEEFILNSGGGYTFKYTISGLPYTYDVDSQSVIANTPVEFTRTIHALAVNNIPEPTPIPLLDQPAFSGAALHLPLLDTKTLTPNQAIAYTVLSVVVIGTMWGLLLRLPTRLRQIANFVLLVVISLAILLWIVIGQ